MLIGFVYKTDSRTAVTPAAKSLAIVGVLTPSCGTALEEVIIAIERTEVTNVVFQLLEVRSNQCNAIISNQRTSELVNRIGNQSLTFFILMSMKLC